MTWPPTNDKWKKADRKTMCLLCSRVIIVVKQNPVFRTTILDFKLLPLKIKKGFKSEWMDLSLEKTICDFITKRFILTINTVLLDKTRK